MSKKGNYISFEETKKIICLLKLKNQKAWFDYSKSGNKPNNIPSAPYRIYKNKGWISWADFLNTKNLSGKDKNKIFLPYP